MMKVAGFLFLCYMAVTSILLFFVALLVWAITAPFDRHLRALHLLTCFWASLYTWSMPAWPVTIKGREKHNSRQTYVIVSNHQSLLDILIFYRLFVHFKWVSKYEIFLVPFIGWNMRLNRYISVKRRDKSSIQQMLKACEKTLMGGDSVFIFPEGTRSKTGKLGAFKAGAFMLAKQMQLPILPIVIQGTQNALPKKSLAFQGKHPISVEVLDEVPISFYMDKTVDEIATYVREKIAEKLPFLGNFN